MDIVEKISVTLNEAELQELIAAELRRQGYVIEGKISINLQTQCRGYGQNEHDETVFTNITCSAKKASGPTKRD